MNISIIGSGYVGLVTGTCISEMGNKVVCMDKNSRTIDNLKKQIIPIYEPGLKEMIQQNVKKNNLTFTSDMEEALQEAEIVFIAVGTPMGSDGSADLGQVLEVAKEIGRNMSHDLIVVDKSTVPVGTADKVRESIASELEKRGVKFTFDVISNPEFLKEGAAIKDFMRPDRVVIGAEKEASFQKMRQLYYPFLRNHDRLIEMDVRSAEMTKYAANAMLATKISFINEIANICELLGADVNKVRIGIGSDSRIGYDFIYPGVGYGGSCFPKDVKALKKMAKDKGYEAKIISSVEEVNNEQKFVIANKILKKYGTNLSSYTFAVWGLTFKPETDDMREAPSIYTINKLVEHGATIKAYDPKANDEAKYKYFKDVPNIEYCKSKYDVLKDADAMILLTEWKEFRSPDFDEMKKNLKNAVIFDGRNQYSNLDMVSLGFEYFQIGKELKHNSIKTY
jgi:UDPglucose 6-dehydrogenase